MRIVLLADRSDIHTVRWVNGLIERGCDVHLVTMHRGGETLHEKAKVYTLPWSAPQGYYTNVFHLRRLLGDLSPDLLHAHYASGYGTLGRLSRYHPYILSVWGQDVYEFPYRSWVHKLVLKCNLRAADCVCSTSEAMAGQVEKICAGIRPIYITPFGVDLDMFSPGNNSNFASDKEGVITVGTVKNLEYKYGIDILIRAFARVYNDLDSDGSEVASYLRLLIVGGGSKRDEYEALSRRLGIENKTKFIGNVSHDKVPKYLRRIDIYVALSRYESFGVAVIEASACGCPVVVSNVGGLPEVVQEEETGLIARRGEVEEAANAIKRLVENGALRDKMGELGRSFVMEKYEWNKSVDAMEEVYGKLIDEEE